MRYKLMRKAPWHDEKTAQKWFMEVFTPFFESYTVDHDKDEYEFL